MSQIYQINEVVEGIHFTSIKVTPDQRGRYFHIEAESGGVQYAVYGHIGAKWWIASNLYARNSRGWYNRSGVMRDMKGKISRDICDGDEVVMRIFDYFSSRIHSLVH